MPSRRLFLFGLVALFVGTAYFKLRAVPREHVVVASPQAPAKKLVAQPLEPEVERVEVKDARLRKVVAAAKMQIGDAYNASYKTISYPNGDVPKGSGACTDVIVRAFRAGGVDLQKLIHEDMKANFGRYPNSWGLRRTDKNIDHRRVPNHITFFKRFGKELPIGTSGDDLKTWQPGDVVEWKLDDGRWHTGIVTDGIGPRGLPLVIHNAWQCVEQDALDEWEIKAHFRFFKPF